MGNLFGKCMASAQEGADKAGVGESFKKAADKGKEVAGKYDGPEMEPGMQKEIPEGALKQVGGKGGTVRIGIKYTSKDGLKVDNEFTALMFDKSGNKLDYVTYNHTTSTDKSITHQGDSRGDDPEEIRVQPSLFNPDVQAVVFCCYIYTSNGKKTFEDFTAMRLVFRAVTPAASAGGVDANETVLPLCHMKLEEFGDFSGVTCLAIFKDSSDKWQVRNVQSTGEGPTHEKMIPACEKLFKDLNITKA